jgi:chromosome segregation ATPase
MADQLMPGEWEAAGRGTLWGSSDTSLGGTLGGALSQEGSFSREARQQQQQRELEEAIAIGRMDPYQANTYVKSKAIRSGIQGIATLFGASTNDSELKMANDLDSIFSTLTEDDIKNPADGLNIVADRLAALGHTKEAITYRLKAESVAQDTIAKKNAATTSRLTQNEKIAKYLGSQANGTLEAFKTVKNKPELKKQFWDNYVSKYEQLAGKEEADKLRALPEDAWEAQLTNDLNGAESAATTSMEQRQQTQIQATKDKELIRASAVVAGQAARAKERIEKIDKELAFKYANLNFRKSQAARKDIEARVEAGDNQVKQISNDIEEVDKALDNFRSKINFAGEDKEAVQLHIATLEAQKQRLVSAKQSVEIANSSFRQQFSDVISANAQAYNPQGGSQPTPQPPGIMSNYARYVKEFNALKGNTAKQKALTDWARSNGIVK